MVGGVYEVPVVKGAANSYVIMGLMGGLDLNQGWFSTSSKVILSAGLVLSSLVTRSLATPEKPFGHLILNFKMLSNNSF